jgi:hypothetical protein
LHFRAIKKYKRAAAAQVLPSHLIRPPPLLRKTMWYLMSHVVDDTRYSFVEVCNAQTLVLLL